MKPLERIFFMVCINEQLRVDQLTKRELDVRDIANMFVRLGFPYKRLIYYVTKWSDRGFYNYGVTLDLGWFEFDKLKGEYIKIYEEVKNGQK